MNNFLVDFVLVGVCVCVCVCVSVGVGVVGCRGVLCGCGAWVCVKLFYFFLI